VSLTIADALRAEGRLEGQVEQARAILRDLLEQRFDSLSPALLQRIGACDDLGRLNAAIRSVYRLASAEDVQI
jgi:hypothetical protein